MKKILFSLIALLCSMSINAQVMKVMKGEEVVATFTSAQANQVVFGESTGEFTLSVELGSVASFLDESYEENYPSATCLAVRYVKNSKNVASVHYFFSDTEYLKEYIDVENASFEELRDFALNKGSVQQGIDAINSGEKVAVWTKLNPNTEYTLIIYAISEEADEYVTTVKGTTAAEPLATTGTAKATIGGSEVDVNWVQLWENGPKFAEYNVGAENNKAEDYGGYYAWGGSQDKVDDHNTGTVDLTGDADTATKLWGSAWRMPTAAELQALIDNCDAEWTENYKETGVKGRVFTGKGDYASNSVFLPAAGYYSGGTENRLGINGRYWSSTPSGEYAFSLRLASSGQALLGDIRDYSYPVRAVLVEE